jgi:phosphohistidine phosphatase
MARELFVLRHAKSSWDDPGLVDHDRPLAPRGRRAAKLLAAHLRSTGIHPEQVLCSTALRTRETLAAVDPGGEALIEPNLYSADEDELLLRLRRVPDTTGSVMVIGHNPAVQMLVLALVGSQGHRGSIPGLRQLEHKFPTAALATLKFSCEWSQLAPGSARLVAFVRPKDLE